MISFMTKKVNYYKIYLDTLEKTFREYLRFPNINVIKI